MAEVQENAQDNVQDSVQDNAQDKVHLPRLSLNNCLSQSQSPLFSKIPPEIRDEIFSHVFMSYEDMSRPYMRETCYSRPGYRAPRRTDTALLQTCKRVYQEAWFRPWALAEHTLWFTSHQRRPLKVTTNEQMQAQLDILSTAGVDVEIEHIRIFAQLYMLDSCVNLEQVLNMNHFRPKCVTICIRHTDWWSWERDKPLYISGTFVDQCRFPESVTRVRMELETLERKKNQLDSIVDQMKQSWHFRRKDGTWLSAHDTPVEVKRWSGVATWSGDRWLRDEVRPNELDYYVSTVTWRPLRASEAAPEADSETPLLQAINPGPSDASLTSSISTHMLIRAGIPLDTPADEIQPRLNAWHEARGRTRAAVGPNTRPSRRRGLARPQT